MAVRLFLHGSEHAALELHPVAASSAGEPVVALGKLGRKGEGSSISNISISPIGGQREVEVIPQSPVFTRNITPSQY